MRLNWMQKAVVHIPAVTATLSGISLGLASYILLNEQGLTMYSAPVAAFFALFGLLLTAAGWGITQQWKKDMKRIDRIRSIS